MAWRYLKFRWLVSLLTLFGVALGAALVCATLALRHESERALSKEAGLYDLVVGGKGSPLQLVLSTVYHLDAPTMNLAYSEYERLRNDPRTLWAAPIGLGDNYAGYRIVGTEPHFFDLPNREGTPIFELARGHIFEQPFEVVLGSHVATATGLDIGDSFFGTHGLVDAPGGEEHRDFPYSVVGVLAPTGAAQDRAIYCPLASVWAIHKAEERLHAPIQRAAGRADDPEPETTAILLRLKNPGLRLWMADEIGERSAGIAAIPINEILRFQRAIIGPVQRALLAVAAAVVVVSCLNIGATLRQAAERRRRDIAILRSLGAARNEVASLVFIEGLLLTVIGIGIGLLIGHGGLAIAAEALRANTGLVIHPWTMPKFEAQALGAMALCGALASLVPAAFLYGRDPIDDLHSSD